MHAAELIEHKRNGEELSAAGVREFIAGYVRGDVPDYQAAAFLMAVWFRGLTPAETFALTDAMVASGETVDLAGRLGRRVVDKHSTGGVGDKVTIAVGPVVAACGVPFGKMSGRALGHTGGTLDKLESIPGFRVELATDELVEQVREIGIAVAGQTADLVPADKRLYALRDVTATIDQVSLIAASIMSKKSAAGASAVVDEEEGRLRAEQALGDGSATAAYGRWVRAQGGDPDPDRLPSAPVVRLVPAPATGYVRKLAAREVAVVAMELGAGREVAGEPIDHAVGVVCLRKRAEEVAAGAPLAEIHAGEEVAAGGC